MAVFLRKIVIYKYSLSSQFSKFSSKLTENVNCCSTPYGKEYFWKQIIHDKKNSCGRGLNISILDQKFQRLWLIHLEWANWKQELLIRWLTSGYEEEQQLLEPSPQQLMGKWFLQESMSALPHWHSALLSNEPMAVMGKFLMRVKKRTLSLCILSGFSDSSVVVTVIVLVYTTTIIPLGEYLLIGMILRVPTFIKYSTIFLIGNNLFLYSLFFDFFKLAVEEAISDVLPILCYDNNIVQELNLKFSLRNVYANFSFTNQAPLCDLPRNALSFWKPLENKNIIQIK